MNAEAIIAYLRDKAHRLPAEGSDVVREARKRALQAVETAAAAVGVDPTLVETDRELRDFDLLGEILRQLRPLARQAETELERRTLMSSPDSAEKVARLGRTARDAPDELDALSKRCVEIADRIRASALPDWNTPKRILERSERLLPSQWVLEDIADRLRRAVRASLDLPYPADEAVRLAALADQIASSSCARGSAAGTAPSTSGASSGICTGS